MPSPASEAQPLSGYRILVGRARHQASALSDELRRLGGEVLEIPFIEIRNPRSFERLDTALQNLRSYDWLILTSVNGVEALWGRIQKLGLGTTDFRHLKIAAIGPATRKAIEDYGLKVDVVPEKYIAESVVSSLRTQVPGKRVLLVRAKVARDVIPEKLRETAATVDVVEAYETVVPASSRRALGELMNDSTRRPHIITFTSSSTVRNFISLLHSKDRAALDGIKLASIGPVTSATLRELGFSPDIEAQEYAIPGLIRAIVAAIA